MLVEDERNNLPWMDRIAVVIGGGFEEVNLLPSQRRGEALRIQSSLELPEEDRNRIAFLIERDFLRRFFRQAFPSSYHIGLQAPGEIDWIVTELVLMGLTRHSIEEAIFEHNSVIPTHLADSRRQVDDPSSPVSTVPPSGLAEVMTPDDSASLRSWHAGNENNTPPREPQGLLNLMYHIAEDQARRDGYVHRGVTCNSCGMMPILGIRYRCANCIDFDLCETCEAMGVHTKTHVFYKVRLPAPFLGNPRHTQQVWYPGKPVSLPRSLPRALARRIMKETSFETPEMDALWEQFRCLASVPWLADPNGLKMAIDRKSFDKCFVPNTSVGCPQENLIYDRMFRFYDTNNDNLIGYEEFIKGLACLNNKNKDEKMRRVFQGYDSDEDGFVSRVDFLRMFRAFYVLTKELTRDMVAGMEDEYGDNQSFNAVTGSQAISGVFNGPDIRDSTVQSYSPTAAKREAENSGEINGEGPLEESNEDTGDRNMVIEDAAQRSALRNAIRRASSSVVSSLPEATMDIYEAMGARHPDDTSDAPQTSSGPAPTLSEGAQQVLQILENRNRPERMVQLEQASTEDLTDALRYVERQMRADHDDAPNAEESRPSSPEVIRRTARGLQAEMGDERAFERLLRATSPQIRSMLVDETEPDSHGRSENAANEEELDRILGRVRRRNAEATEQLEQQRAGLEAAAADAVAEGLRFHPTRSIGATNGSPPFPPSDIDFSRPWSPTDILPEDVVTALGRDIPLAEITDIADRRRVNWAAIQRISREDAAQEAAREEEQEASQDARLSEIRKRSVQDRWRRRQFYVDEEEGATAPQGYVDGNEAQSGEINEGGSPSAASDSHPPSPRSRSSSKVRFQDDYLTDTDYDTRSNHSNSSRSIPIAERWGGYRMRESEKDVGKEILYQASQQGLNELLDTLFKPKEDMFIEAENAAPERQKWKDRLDELEANQEPRTVTLNMQVLIAMEEAQARGQIFHGTVEDIQLREVYDMRSQSPSPESPDFISHPPAGNTAATSSQTLQSLIRNSTGPLPSIQLGEDGPHDPTLPQFRPDSPEPQSPGSVNSALKHFPHSESDAVAPSQAQLQRYLLHRRIEAEANERRGGGKLDFKEFEEVMNGERGRKLQFVGAWIEMASFWSP
jgi:hypothetical protein